jgi:hypothetical protein
VTEVESGGGGGGEETRQGEARHGDL